MTISAKKHPCRDCFQCQWCSDDRCRRCLKTRPQPRLSIREQIALYERLNDADNCLQVEDKTPKATP